MCMKEDERFTYMLMPFAITTPPLAAVSAFCRLPIITRFASAMISFRAVEIPGVPTSVAPPTLL